MNRRKLDIRPQYIKELMRSTPFMGYRVTESGVVYNAHDKLIKPKFYFKGDKIDYVYIDVTYEGKKQRISYHRFIYMAWNPEFAQTNDPSMVITTIGRRFDYSLKNLKCVTKQEHLQELAKSKMHFDEEDAEQIRETYAEIKDVMSKKDYAKRLQVSPHTLNKILKGTNNGH